jgi:hypothetical protein
MAQAQLMAEQDIANQNAELQTSIAAAQEDQAARALGFQQDQAALSRGEALDQQVRQQAYDTSRNQLQQQATDWVNNTFSKYDDNYYNDFAKQYMATLSPEIDRQYTQARGNLLFGLARGGNLGSQAHADQQGLLDETRGRAFSDLATQASQASQTLKQQVADHRQSLLGQILSTGALGQPVAPNQIDQVNASIDQTNRAINNIQLTGQDQLASIGQLPSSSTLGNIFGAVGSGVANFLSGNQAFNVANAGTGTAGAGTGPTAQKPS